MDIVNDLTQTGFTPSWLFEECRKRPSGVLYTRLPVLPKWFSEEWRQGPSGLMYTRLLPKWFSEEWRKGTSGLLYTRLLPKWFSEKWRKGTRGLLNMIHRADKYNLVWLQRLGYRPAIYVLVYMTTYPIYSWTLHACRTAWIIVLSRCWIFGYFRNILRTEHSPYIKICHAKTITHEYKY